MVERSDYIKFPVHKFAAKMRVSEEQLAWQFGFHQRGHYESVEPTDEEKAAHARAIEIVAEIESNPYIDIGGDEAEVTVSEMVTERWVADETNQEWLARFREWRAANPDAEPRGHGPFGWLLRDFATALDRSIIASLIAKDGEAHA